MIKDIFMDAGMDVLKMLPFLFAAFLVIEVLEHYSAEFTEKIFGRARRAGPAAGAVLGCFPQCGFSVMAANLYAGSIISAGTLLAVFIATSDEAVLIMLGNPDRGKEILTLFAVKVLVAVIAGYTVDLFRGKYMLTSTLKGYRYDRCGCHDEKEGIFIPAFRHTVRIFLFLFMFTVVLNLCIEIIGMERLSEYLFHDTWFQPVIAAFIGLIPNCAASVLLTRLYLSGVISFSSVIAGLCTGAGAGLVVLFKMNRNRKENIKILILLYGTGVAAGLFLNLLGK